MATNIEAANLVNKVIYKTDKKSLKSVREDMKKLQQDFSKTTATALASPTTARQTVRNVKKQATQVMDAHVSQMEAVAKLRSKQAAKNVQKSFNDILGVNKAPQKSARDSANAFKKVWADQAQTVKEAKDKMTSNAKEMIAQQSTIDAMFRARDKQQKRDRKGELVANRMSFEASRFKLGREEAMRFSGELENLNRRYRQGKIELDEYRESSRQLLRTTKDLSKEHMTLGERIRSLRKGGNGGFGIGGAVAGVGLLGAGALGYMGLNAARNSVNSAVLQSRGLSRVSSMGILPEETQALQLAALRATGFDLSFEKISDISKDVQDKVGQLSLGEWKQDKKTGAWSFSGGGEMADWLKIMTERGGYTREGSIQALRNIKGPVELGVMLEGLRKTAKLTDAEFTALAEAVNDFSYIAKSVGDEGSNVVDTLRELREAGLLYTQAQRDNMKELSNMSATFQKYNDFMQGSFGSSFLDGLKTAGVDSKNLAKTLAGFTPIIDALGKSAGELTGSFLKLGELINNLLSWRKNFQSELGLSETPGLVNPETMSLTELLGQTWSALSNLGGGSSSPNSFTPGNIMSAPYMYGTGPGNSAWNPYNININPAPVVVQVQPSDEFGTMFNAVADERIQWAFDDQSFQINQSILGE